MVYWVGSGCQGMVCPCTYRDFIADFFPFQDYILFNTEKKGLGACAEPNVEVLFLS